MTFSSQKSSWNKVLYVPTDENNLVDENYFLQDSQVTAYHAAKRDYGARDLFGVSFRVLARFAYVFTFVFFYVGIDSRWISDEAALTASLSASFLGYAAYHQSIASLVHIKNALIFLLFGYGLSPVLYELTDSISTDSIYSMSFFMFLIHLIFYHYGGQIQIVSNVPLSLNAALFGSVCLASRLESHFQAFVLLCIAVEFFVLLPLIRNDAIHIAFLFGFIATIPYFFTVFPVKVMTTTVGVMIFVGVICPILFGRWQRHKVILTGPWEEATLIE